MNKEFNRFVSLVSDMRTLQKLYFKNRDKYTLTQYKEAEKAVDEWIKDIKKTWNSNSGENA